MANAALEKPVISIRGLCNRFGSHDVHENLELDVYPGEILGIVGGSGTGKSVLLRSIIGLRRPDAGTINILGTDIHKASDDEKSLLEKQIGVLFQKGALFTSLSVIQNIAFPLIEHAGLTRSQAEWLAGIKLNLAGLPLTSGHLYPAELSGGMIKRVALARALALDPAIIFLDEPTAGLDPISAAEFDQLLLTLRNALGLTVVLVTHDLDTLYTTCDRVAILSRGRVLAAGPLDEVENFEDDWVRRYFHGPRGKSGSNRYKEQ